MIAVIAAGLRVSGMFRDEAEHSRRTRVRNASQIELVEFLDDKMFLEMIRTNLIKYSDGKYVFLDRDISEEIERERQDKRSGERQAAGELRQKYGADYFLTGTISAIDRFEGTLRTVYTRYAFRLVDAETEVVVWEDSYETKKTGKTPVHQR